MALHAAGLELTADTQVRERVKKGKEEQGGWEGGRGREGKRERKSWRGRGEAGRGGKGRGGGEGRGGWEGGEVGEGEGEVGWVEGEKAREGSLSLYLSLSLSRIFSSSSPHPTHPTSGVSWIERGSEWDRE